MKFLKFRTEVDHASLHPETDSTKIPHNVVISSLSHFFVGVEIRIHKRLYTVYIHFGFRNTLLELHFTPKI
jgi:hypothetical protein